MPRRNASGSIPVACAVRAFRLPVWARARPSRATAAQAETSTIAMITAITKTAPLTCNPASMLKNAPVAKLAPSITASGISNKIVTPNRTTIRFPAKLRLAASRV